MGTSQPKQATFTGVMKAAALRLAQLFAGAPSAAERAALPARRPEKLFPDRLRVLAVEDHLENRLGLEALLYRWGIRPLHAGDGAEAVALACGQHFDLILMDVHMPILDGLTATAQIRRFEHGHGHPRAPIVAYSSSTLGGDWPLLRACGFDDSLQKPCNPRSLKDCLQRWCGDGARKASASRAGGAASESATQPLAAARRSSFPSEHGGRLTT